MQFVATCEKISEAFLLPVIRQLLEGFPFVILGFHSDNGSEYINYNYEKFKSVPSASVCLKPGITFEQLDAQAAKMSGNDAALAP